MNLFLLIRKNIDNNRNRFTNIDDNRNIMYNMHILEGEVYKGCKRMSPIRNQLVEMIDCLPEQEQILVFEIVKRFVPDDVATDDVRAIQAAHEEYA